MTRPARLIPFTKATACGNDFLLIDAQHAPADIARFTREICDRHDGVGADGVEWMSRSDVADAAIRLINADGSEAEISGNGTRCVAAYVCSLQPKERVSILTGAGMKTCFLISHSGSEFEFETDMGAAAIDPELRLQVGNEEVRGIPVSMGNPHYVVFVDEIPADWQSRAANIQRSQKFPQGVNVEFAQVNSRSEVTARFFERGAGETRSSGTGSCASAVAAVSTRRVEPPVKVHAPGGTQTVRLDAGTVLLRGPARLTVRGDFVVPE